MIANDLAIIDQTALTIGRAPEMVLDEAHDAAKALKRVIEAKPNKVMFGGEQYLEFEDWQTVGRFYGIAPRVVSSRYVEYGDAQGWEATAEAVHVPTQRVVSSADAMCLNDEEKWSDRPKYAYVYHKKSGGTSVEDPGKDELIWEQGSDGKRRPKKERMLVGTERVPMFQLRSMAQTRAGSKALRNALAWVVVLAGYRPTPAEEMGGGPPEPVAVNVAVEPPAVSVIDASDQKARALFPEYQPGEARTEPTVVPSGPVSLETERSLYLGKINDWRTRRGVTEARFAELCKAEGLEVAKLGQADPGQLSDLMNRVIKEPKK